MKTEGWEKLLNEHIAEAYRHQFEWGKRDCALWCADWVWKATGRDLGAEWRGKYKTENGAAKLMRKKGYHGVEAIADRHLLSCPVNLAQRGDILLNEDNCLGICNGRNAYFITEDSITMRHTLECVKAWTVE